MAAVQARPHCLTVGFPLPPYVSPLEVLRGSLVHSKDGRIPVETDLIVLPGPSLPGAYLPVLGTLVRALS